MTELDRIRIGYKRLALRRQIEQLKKELANSDYKVLKMYEYSLLTENAAMPCPYDCEDVHRERQAIRDQINWLENELEDLN